MDWTDEGIIIRARPHGETSAVIELLTPSKGRHAGLVRGGRGKRLRGVLQPGNRVRAHWRARLEEHLGYFEIEAAEPFPAELLDDRVAISGLNAACALLARAAPEREAHPRLFEAFASLIAHMEQPDVWPALMVRFEAGFLAEIGFGLDLRKCAATGQTSDLVYVSPRSGRAVSAAAGEPYKDKMLPLPEFLISDAPRVGEGDVRAGFALTGYFLERWVLWPTDKQLPEARAEMLERLEAAGRL